MAMVTDFLIGFLLLLSAAINILALSAFLITPSLRSTSNRFVINLLIVNVIGCLILAPSLLFNSNVIRNLYSEETTEPTSSTRDDGANQHSATTTPATTSVAFSAFNKSSAQAAMLAENSRRQSSTGTKTIEINSTMYRIDTHLPPTTTSWLASIPKATEAVPDESDTPYHRMRPWILDVIAAIGALSLLLVIGDTYVGVTDPLRYHSRVSASRVCILIVIVWCTALGFGVTSAFRSEEVIKEDMNSNNNSNNTKKQEHNNYNTAFGGAYFLCIILIPFSLVCAMYWGIIREARKNGLRLRHNGSSPLLQSVLHIGPHHHQQPHCPSATETPKREFLGKATSGHDTKSCCCNENLSINTNSTKHYPTHNNNTNTNGQPSLGAVLTSSLRRNKSAQHLTSPTCQCCDQILITRSISNQSAYYNGAHHLKVSNRDLLRTARSNPELHQNLLSAEQSSAAALERIRLPRRAPTTKSSLGYMTSIRHRLSNASSLFKYREESRAARISILVVIMFLVSYIPFGLLVLTEGHESFLSTYQQTVLAIFFVVLANIMSPLIFAYRNKRVRRGIKRLVSAHGKAVGGTNKEQRNNNNSIKELSERHHAHNSNSNSPKMIKLARHTLSSSPSVDMVVSGHGQSSLPAAVLLQDNNGLPPPLPECVQRRKLVIFNGKNGQITKVCHPDHHHNSIKCPIHTKGCNKDKLLTHKNACCWSRTEMGCPTAHAVKLATSYDRGSSIRANQKTPKVKHPSVSSASKDMVEAEPFLRRIRTSSGQIFKKSSLRARVPQVNIDYASKPIDV